MAGTHAAGPGQPWRKVLYERQGPDDAHTTAAFLEALVVNATVAKRTYGRVVRDSLQVNQQLSTVTLVATASYLLTQGRLTPGQLLMIQALLLVVGLVLYWACTLSCTARGSAAVWPAFEMQRSGLRAGCSSCGCFCGCAGAASPGHGRVPGHPAAPYQHVGTINGAGTRKRLSFAPPPTSPRAAGLPAGCHLPAPPDTSSPPGIAPARGAAWPARQRRAPWRPPLPMLPLRALAISAGFLAGVGALSPVYASLTRSVSTDTVVLLSVLLLVVHLALWDYRWTGRSLGRAGAASLAAALASSVLVASRARGAAAAFAQITLALEAYVLLPLLRQAVQAASPAAHIGLTLGLLGVSVGLLAPLSVLLATSALCAAAFVSLICPMWLVRAGKFKAQINGPWDEAAPKLGREVAVRVASPRRSPGPRQRALPQQRRGL